MILEMRNICKDYPMGKTVTRVLRDVSLNVSEGEYLAIMGPSGSGKTTLMNIIGCLDEPTSGSYLLCGQDITACTDLQLAQVRNRELGFVFQSFHLLPRLTALDNVALPLLYGGVKKAERRERARAALEMVGLGDRIDHRPDQLSGGQCQRVAIARALVKRPDILLLDEPLSNLDARLRLEMREEIRRIQTETGVTTVFVTHDQEEAMSITDEIVLMRTGVVQQQCPPQQMYLNPANRFVAGFLGNPPINFFRLDVCGGTVCLAEDYMLRVHGAADGPVLVGIRPEAWRLGQGLRTAAEAVEMRGKDLLVTFSLAGERARAILDITAGVAAGDAVELTLEPRLVYIFDPETGARLDAEVAG